MRQKRPVLAQASVVRFLPQRLFDLGFVENGVVTEKFAPIVYLLLCQNYRFTNTPHLFICLPEWKKGQLVLKFGKALSLQSTKVIIIHHRLASRYREQRM